MKIYNFNEATKIYRGADHACRCGCKGSYAEPESAAFKKRVIEMTQLVAKGAAVDDYDGCVNISLPNNKALTAYFD